MNDKDMLEKSYIFIKKYLFDLCHIDKNNLDKIYKNFLDKELDETERQIFNDWIDKERKIKG